jgi:hypothetical protein
MRLITFIFLLIIAVGVSGQYIVRDQNRTVKYGQKVVKGAYYDFDQDKEDQEDDDDDDETPTDDSTTYKNFMDSATVVFYADFEDVQTSTWISREDLLNAYGYSLSEYYLYGAMDGFWDRYPNNIYLRTNWAKDNGTNVFIRSVMPEGHIEFVNRETDQVGGGHQFRLKITGKWGTYDELYQTANFRWHSAEDDAAIYNGDGEPNSGKLPVGFQGSANSHGKYAYPQGANDPNYDNDDNWLTPNNPPLWSTGCYGSPCDGFVYDHAFQDFHVGGVNQDTNMHTVTSYFKHWNQTSAYGDLTYYAPNGTTFIYDSYWHNITIYVKMNTVGVNDGKIVGWIDGVKAFERTGLKLRHTSARHIDWIKTYFTFGGYADYLNHPNSAGRDTYLDFDEHYIFNYDHGYRDDNLLLPNWDVKTGKPIFNGVVTNNEAGNL